MKPVVKAIYQALNLVKEFPQIYGIYVVFLWFRWVSNSSLVPWYLDLFLLCLALAWAGARYTLITQALNNKSLTFKDFPKNLWTSFRLLVPLIITFILVLMLPLIILILLYGCWFSSLYLDRGLGLTSEEVWQRFLPALFNLDIWQEFLHQNVVMVILSQLFLVMIIVGLLVAKLITMYLVVERFSYRQAIVKSLEFLSWHLPLVIGFLSLQIIANVMLGVTNNILLNVGNFLNLTLASWLFILVEAFTLVVLDSFVVAYVLKHTVTIPGLRKSRLWWRERRLKGLR